MTTLPIVSAAAQMIADDAEEIARLRHENARLKELNQKLNNRANYADSYWQSRAIKAELTNDHGRNAWKHEFDRMMAAHEEIKEIYLLVCDAEGRRRPPFHSVMDSKFGESPGKSPGVWANMYQWTDRGTAEGPITSERVVDAVRRVLSAKKCSARSRGDRAPACSAAPAGERRGGD